MGVSIFKPIIVIQMLIAPIMMVHMNVNVILDGLVMVTIHVTTKTNVHSAKMIVMIKINDCDIFRTDSTL